MTAGERITVKVLFFGAARDAAGTSEVSLDAPAPASVRSVKETIFSTYKPVSQFAGSLMVAINEEYATDDTAVKDHDIVAFLPPVSGG